MAFLEISAAMVRSSSITMTVTKSDLLIDGSDYEFRRLVHNLLAFSARLEEVRSRFGSYIGLTGIQYTILVSVNHHNRQFTERANVKAVAQHLSISGAFVTSEATKLVKLDLLAKTTNSEDRRKVELDVTGRGRELLKKLAPMQREVNDSLFESLDSRAFQDLSKMAGRLKSDADKALLLADYLGQK